MIWTWADPGVEPNPDQDPNSQISNLLRRFHETGGTARAFQRDLPYGFELLGENLADISHLPFSHHSVGALNRGDGRPVPLEMISGAEKRITAKLQGNNHDDGGGKLPLYQARVKNASEHDPEIVAALKYNPALQAVADNTKATCTIGFFDPCHIRYHRNQGIPGSSYEIDLFMCPTAEGRSRVFLFTPFEKLLSKEDGKEYRPSGLMQRTANKLGANKLSLFSRAKKKSFSPHIGHMIAHSIFDGDGIFLNKQGDRMRRANHSTYKDYHTPTSADLLVNAFRRWLGKAVEVTRAAGHKGAASAAAGDGDNTYNDNRPRAELLDRYASHTATCNICQTALKSLKQKRDRLSLLSTTLIGATGASGVILVCSSAFLLVSRVLLRESASRGVAFRATLSVMLTSALAIAASWAGVKNIAQQKVRLNKEIRQFYFEDYIHAEKD